MWNAALGLAGSLAGSAISGIGANKNLSAQKDNLEYMKWVQEKTWEREDNATQRRKADLIAAGFSPVLAAGAPASTSSPIKTEAPQLDTSYLRQAAQMAADSPSKWMQNQLQQQAMTQSDETIAKTRAERDLIQLQQDRVKADTMMQHAQLGLMPTKLDQLLVNIANKKQATQNLTTNEKNIVQQILTSQHNLSLSQMLGQRTNEPITPYSLGAGAARKILDSGSNTFNSAKVKEYSGMSNWLQHNTY